MDLMQSSKPKLKFCVTGTYIQACPNICFKDIFSTPIIKKKQTTQTVKGFDSYPENLSLLPDLHCFYSTSWIHLVFPFFL